MVIFMTTRKWSMKIIFDQITCKIVKLYMLIKHMYFSSHNFNYDHGGHFMTTQFKKQSNILLFAYMVSVTLNVEIRMQIRIIK